MSKGNKDLLKHIIGYCNQIGEAHSQFGNNLTEDFREATAGDIPWKQIRGLRNVVAHEYGNIDEESLWETITEDIPVLYKFCTHQIEMLNDQNPNTSPNLKMGM